MTPPPPKLGQRDLFNDSFFSFLKRKDKSQPQPAPPPGGPQSPDLSNRNGHANPKTDDSLGQKKVLLHEGHRILDSTKDLLERNQHFFRKETLKRLRKEAAKLTKGAPAKNKLPKKTLVDVSGFQESAKTLYQEVDNIIREMDHEQGQYPGLALAQQGQGGRSGSESPPPLPRKPPSPKVTFPAELKSNPLARHQSVRHGYELSDPPATMAHEETVKHRYRDKEADPRRGSSQRADDRNDSRRDDDRYRDRDDRYRSRRASERHRDDYYRDRERDKDRDRNRSHRQDYYSSRPRRYDDRDRDREYREYPPRGDRDRDRERRDRYRDRDRDRDRDGERHRDRDRDRDRDRHRDRAREKEAVNGEETASADQTPQRVVHPDIPLSATPSGSNHGVPINPTIVAYPVDEEGRRRDRDREKEGHYRDREREHRDRDKERRERDRDRDKEHDQGDRDRDRDRDRDQHYGRRDGDYSYKSRDRHKPSRRYEVDDDYRGSGRSRRDRDRERDGEREGHQESERERDKGRRLHQASDTPPSPTDPLGSKFQEVFSPAEHAGGMLPPHFEAAA